MIGKGELGLSVRFSGPGGHRVCGCGEFRSRRLRDRLPGSLGIVDFQPGSARENFASVGRNRARMNCDDRREVCVLVSIAWLDSALC